MSGNAHKEKLMQVLLGPHLAEKSTALAEGAKLAGRVSGDSTVAYAWAYAMAVESAAGVTPPPRALWLRALLLERERVANHLGDLGYLGNDAGLAFGLSQLTILKEEWLRSNAAVFGHRYLMDAILPGGVARDLPSEAAFAAHMAGVEAFDRAPVRIARPVAATERGDGFPAIARGTGRTEADPAGLQAGKTESRIARQPVHRAACRVAEQEAVSAMRRRVP